MSVFKIQKVRDCLQCGNGLPLKCESCSEHPERKPRVMEFHNWPPILKVAECGCCVLVSCQNQICPNKVWRNKKQSSTGLSRSASLFCSKRCNLVSLNAVRDTRTSVRCGWHECRNTIMRRASMLKTFKKSYCRPSHYHWDAAKRRHEAKESALKAQADAAESTDRGLLHCASCKDITEHDTRASTAASCLTCGTRRQMENSAMTRGLTQNLKLASGDIIHR